MEKKKANLFNVFIERAGGGIAPALVLKIEKEFVPIYVGLSEAISTNKGLKEKKSMRPLPHDLILDYLNKKEVEIKEIIIDDLEEGVYFAQLILKKKKKEFKIDARPSDCLALVSRTDAPIFVKKEIIDEASVTEEKIKEKMKSIEKYL